MLTWWASKLSLLPATQLWKKVYFKNVLKKQHNAQNSWGLKGVYGSQTQVYINFPTITLNVFYYSDIFTDDRLNIWFYFILSWKIEHYRVVNVHAQTALGIAKHTGTLTKYVNACVNSSNVLGTLLWKYLIIKTFFKIRNTSLKGRRKENPLQVCRFSLCRGEHSADFLSPCGPSAF